MTAAQFDSSLLHDSSTTLQQLLYDSSTTLQQFTV